MSVNGFQDHEILQKYIISLYWAFMTMTTVGYGDIVPYSSSEKLLTILIMCISCGVFAWILG